MYKKRWDLWTYQHGRMCAFSNLNDEWSSCCTEYRGTACRCCGSAWCGRWGSHAVQLGTSKESTRKDMSDRDSSARERCMPAVRKTQRRSSGSGKFLFCWSHWQHLMHSEHVQVEDWCWSRSAVRFDDPVNALADVRTPTRRYSRTNYLD